MSYILGAIIGYFGGIVLHEMGHAAAAKLNGWSIKGFCIGEAPFIWEGMIGKTKMQVGLFPISGKVLAIPKMQSSRSKYVFFAASGIFVNAILFLVAFYANMNSENGWFPMGVMITQALLVVTNLIPQAANHSRIANDGHQIWSHIKASKTPFETWKESLNRVYAPYSETPDTKFDPTERFYDFGKVLAENGQLSKSRAIDNKVEFLKKFQNKAALPISEELLILDLIITDILLYDFERSASKLVELGERAFSIGAYSSAIRQTYRSVLVEVGRFADALTFFEPGEEKSKSDFVRALNLIYHARAENGAGNPLLAKDLSKEAKALVETIPQAPDFVKLLARMNDELNSGGVI
jgi:hypothetical protein